MGRLVPFKKAENPVLEEIVVVLLHRPTRKQAEELERFGFEPEIYYCHQRDCGNGGAFDASNERVSALWFTYATQEQISFLKSRPYVRQVMSIAKQ